MDSCNIKQELECNLVYAIDNNTELEFIRDKVVIVIDKDHFLVCKQLMLDNAPDEDFAEFLNIPVEKVRYFKHKMQIFEDSIRARRRAARLNAKRKRKVKPMNTKRQISSEERFKKARELIGKNYSVNQISKILKMSERSVTRFKKRMREEKNKLKAEGKIQSNPDDPDDDDAFKYLATTEKVKRIKRLFDQGLKIYDISTILKISERSVRRWKDKLAKMEKEGEIYELEVSDNKEQHEESKIDSDEDDEESRPRRKRRAYLDREKVQYATELLENGLSNKEMSMLLELSISSVRKLKTKIQNGTIEELIDDSEEVYQRITKKEEKNDPLNMTHVFIPTLQPKISKRKMNLSDRDMYIVRLLRENQIRTMDIAKLVGISERSVTRLLTKAKDLTDIEYAPDIIEEVERLLTSKDEILNDVIVEESDVNATVVCEDSKENVAVSLLAMNVKIKDIAKMLDIPEKTVHKWRTKVIKEEIKEEIIEEEYSDIVEPKEEYIIEYIEQQ